MAVILVGRPQQGTISRWPNAKKAVENIVEGRRLNPSIDLLFPYQQEIMCSEFLRSPVTEDFGLPRLAHLLLPVGQTMKDIDIYGVGTDGRKIIAQVTHLTSEKSVGKLEGLRRYGLGQKKHLIFFCQDEERTEQGDVIIVPIKSVYKRFVQTDAGRLWLKSATELFSQIHPSER